MKILGALLAFSSCFSVGMVSVAAAKRRIRTLKVLIMAIERMSVELSSRLTPIPEIVGLLSHSKKGGAEDFFTELSARISELGEIELSELWRECAEQVLTALSADELCDFAALGCVLGRGDLSSQLSALNHCKLRLDEALNAARGELSQKSRLCLGVSGSIGLMLVIMLI